VALQRDLQALGYLPTTAVVDGVYGAATRSAILAWQRSKGVSETGFLGRKDGIALATQASDSTLPNREDISILSCHDVTGASPDSLIPAVAAQIQYMQQHYPELTRGWGPFVQPATAEALQQAKDVGDYVKLQCNLPEAQSRPLSSVLDAAAGLIRANRLGAWLNQHRQTEAPKDSNNQLLRFDEHSYIRSAVQLASKMLR
jgi:peptidoglycan hydrolase-like protein with peptidoglycan-binding domain